MNLCIAYQSGAAISSTPAGSWITCINAPIPEVIERRSNELGLSSIAPSVHRSRLLSLSFLSKFPHEAPMNSLITYRRYLGRVLISGVEYYATRFPP